MEKKIVILYGLPGSGKTYFANQLSDALVVDLDKIYLSKKDEENKSNTLNKQLKYSLRRSQTIVLDGLLTTQSDLQKIINEVVKIEGYEYKFAVVCWEENRETCLHNDRGRRKLNSEITIKNLPYEKINPLLFPECKITIKEIVKKPQYDIWVEENQLNKDYLYSDSWLIEGISGNCWNKEKNYRTPDPVPENFENFDRLIESICPNISFLKYKRIYKECVTVEETYSQQYYGGSSTYGRYKCDLKKLYKVLENEGLVK